MKKIILPLLALICNQSTISAQFKIEEGPVLDKAENGKVAKILGGDKNNFYVLRENGKGKGQKYFIEQYSLTDFAKGFSTQLPIAENAQNVESYFTGDKSILFYCTQESKYTTSRLLYCSIDTKGSSSGEVELMTINNRDPEKDLWVFPSYYFAINISPDKKHIAIVTRTYGNKGKQLQLMLNVFNSATMVKEWDKDITETGGKNYVVDNNGNVMYIDFPDDNNKRNLVIIDSNEKKISKIPLTLNAGQEMEGVNITSKENVIVVGGFFKEKLGESKKAGAFSQLFDLSSKSLIKSNQEYFPEELSKSLFVAEDDFKEKYIDVNNVRTIGDDYYFIGKDVEHDFINKEHTSYSSHTTYNVTPTASGASMSHTTTMSSRTSTTHSATYSSNKTIIFKVNAEGKTEWIKDVSSTSTTPVSPQRFLVSANNVLRPEILNMEMNGKLLIIHGDTRFVMMSMKASNVSYSLFDSKGTVRSEKLCNDDKTCFLYNSMGLYGFFNIYYPYEKNVIVYFNQKDNQHFGRIVFN